MVPEQTPFSGLNSGTTVGTLTVTVLGMVPKQKPFYTHPSGPNFAGCGIDGTTIPGIEIKL